MWKIRGVPVKSIAVYSGIQFLGLLVIFVSRAKEFTLRVDNLKTTEQFINYINENDKVWFIFLFTITIVNTIFQCYWWNSKSRPKIHKVAK